MFDGLFGAIAHAFGSALGVRMGEHEQSGRYALIVGWSALGLVCVGMVVILVTMF